MPKSLRWRIAIFLILLIVIVMGILAAYLANHIKKSTLATWNANLKSSASILAVETAPDLAAGDYSSLDSLAGIFKDKLNARVTIIRVDGKVITDTDYDPAEMENHLYRPEVQSALQGKSGSDIRFSETLRSNLLYIAMPIQEGEAIIGVARIAVPTAQVDREQQFVLQSVITAIILSSFMAVIGVIVLSGITTRGLRGILRYLKESGQTSRLENQARFALDEVSQLDHAYRTLTSQLNNQIEELSLERSRLTAVLRTMTDGVLIVDPDSHLLLINPAAIKIFNGGDDVAVGTSLVEFVRHHQFVDLWQKCRDSGEQQTVVTEVPPDRTIIQAIATPLDLDVSNNTLMVFQDQTRVRKLELVRRDFVSNVSHELRTPLASMKAVTDTLLEGALNKENIARRFLIQLDGEIDNLTQLVQELLELSRIESGKTPLEKTNISPSELVNRSMERMRLQAERAGVSISVDCPNNLPDVIADPSRMAQVLVNLIHNAIKFTNPGGSITIRARSSDNQVIFSIEDTGIGITPDNLSRIFERFYKTDPARSGEGTGLGLSIARHLVESHNGKIWAESSPGSGSIFFFSLPQSN